MNNHGAGYVPANAIDGNTNSASVSLDAAIFNWFQIDFGHTETVSCIDSLCWMLDPIFLFQNINEVLVVKIPSLLDRFYSVELRIGDNTETGTGKVQLNKNPVAGLFGAATTDPDYTFVVDPYMDGRYLTLQKISDNYLSIAELYVTKMV